MFEIKEATKQGDLSSSLLFNTVLQVALLAKEKMGDDDVLLFASIKEQLQKMLCDFKHSTEKVGLMIQEKRRF